MDLLKLMETARQSEEAAAEAFDLAVHIAMVEAVKQVSARWPRRKVELTAGMGSCTIDVTGSSGGRPIRWRFYWDTDGVWEVDDVHWADTRHQVYVGHKLTVESDLITQISQMNDEVRRDPIDYAPAITCLGGVVIPQEFLQ